MYQWICRTLAKQPKKGRNPAAAGTMGIAMGRYQRISQIMLTSALKPDLIIEYHPDWRNITPAEFDQYIASQAAKGVGRVYLAMTDKRNYDLLLSITAMRVFPIPVILGYEEMARPTI
jgi:hypothetical protein